MVDNRTKIIQSYRAGARTVKQRQRELIARWIEDTIISPDRVSPTYKGRYLAQKKIRDTILEVVYAQMGDDIFLITAYFIDK